MTSSTIPMSLYTLFQQDGLPVVLFHGKDVCFVPFFTSPEYANAFLSRASLAGCKMRPLITLEIVNRHIAQVASSLAKRSPTPAFRIVVDPIETNAGTTLVLMEPEQFVTAVEQFDKPE
jgi:hypothetical protein